eukprot:TRINITY_DN1764_c0_g1_i13.p2 TRINITY_DN1764_c0_g1~~TRINITY_DN1764_c0_g1_i13.p2  ORF type:complete len:197 (-),score=53.90 TRINITY_DN1764_c0_g1_i13:626-1216(-)
MMTYGASRYAQPTTTFATAPRTVQAAVAAPVITYGAPAVREIDVVQPNGAVLREFVGPTGVQPTQEIDFVQPNGTIVRDFVQDRVTEVDIVQPNGTVLREFVHQPVVTEVVQAPAPRTYAVVSEQLVTREELIRQGRLESGEGRENVLAIREAQVIRKPHPTIVQEIDVVQPVVRNVGGVLMVQNEIVERDFVIQQ